MYSIDPPRAGGFGDMSPYAGRCMAPNHLDRSILALTGSESRVEPEVVKYASTDPQVALLREIAAATEAVALPPEAVQTAWTLEKRGPIKRTWRGSGHVAVVTSDDRYYLKHGKHPREVQAEQERLEGDGEQAALVPADRAELIARLRSASGKVTVPDPAPQTRGRWRAAFYGASTTATCRPATSCAGRVGSGATVSSRWSTRRPRRPPSLLGVDHRCPGGPGPSSPQSAHQFPVEVVL